MGRPLLCDSFCLAEVVITAFSTCMNTYLLQSGSFTLSVYYNKRLRHFAIKQTEDGRFNIGDYNFKTLGKVVRYYQGHPLFYEDKPVTLTDPVPVTNQQ